MNVCSSWQLYKRAWTKVLLIPSQVSLPRLRMELFLGQWTEQSSLAAFPSNPLVRGHTRIVFSYFFLHRLRPSGVLGLCRSRLLPFALGVLARPTDISESWWLLCTWLLIGFGHKVTSMIACHSVSPCAYACTGWITELLYLPAYIRRPLVYKMRNWKVWWSIYCWNHFPEL